jgi:hypothetical protein
MRDAGNARARRFYSDCYSKVNSEREKFEGLAGYLMIAVNKLQMLSCLRKFYTRFAVTFVLVLCCQMIEKRCDHHHSASVIQFVIIRARFG